MTSEAKASSDDEAVVEATTVKSDSGRGEVSAQTIARMMGLMTLSDLKLLDGKLDLLVSRLGTISVRLDKVSSLLQQAPTANDMERIDVQIGTLRSSMRELLAALKASNMLSSPDSAELINKSAKELDSLPEGFEQK